MGSLFAGHLEDSRVAVPRTALDVVCLGEAVWDLTPFGESGMRFRPGGGAVTSAVALARSGLRVGLAAALGDQSASRALVSRVAAAGVDVRGVRLVQAHTGLVVLEAAGGAQRVIPHRAEDNLPADVPEGWEAPVLLISGVSPALAPMAGLCRAARRARRTGAHVVVDLNTRWHVWAGRDPRTLHALLREADVVRCSAADLFVLELDEARLRAVARPSSTLVLTHGAGVARAMGPFGEVAIAPSSVVQTATGAGDVFTATICAELARDRAHGPERPAFWAQALRRAHAAALAALRAR